MDINRARQEINDLDFTFLKSDFQEKHAYSDSEYEAAVAGLKRFFSLTLCHDGPLAVTNKSVDALWHTFILHTPHYRAFCLRAFGTYLDHQPNGAETPVPASAFTNLMEAHKVLYGPLDEFWVDDLPVAARADVLAGRAPAELNFLWSGWTGWPSEDLLSTEVS